MSLPEAFAIFSDDIRHEVCGKTSVMGIYAGVMNIHTPEFPATLVRLGITVYLKWYAREEIESVGIQVFFPNDIKSPAIKTTVDLIGALDELPDSRPDSHPGATLSSVIDGVPIIKGGAIEVFVEGASGRRRIGRLRTIHVPPPDADGGMQMQKD